MNRREFLKNKGFLIANFLVVSSGMLTFLPKNKSYVAEITSSFKGSMSQFKEAFSHWLANPTLINKINSEFIRSGSLKRININEKDSEMESKIVWRFEFVSKEAAQSWQKAFDDHAAQIWTKNDLGILTSKRYFFS